MQVTDFDCHTVKLLEQNRKKTYARDTVVKNWK